MADTDETVLTPEEVAPETPDVSPSEEAEEKEEE